MNTTSPHASLLRSALEHPTRGVVGLVDDLLKVCQEHGLQLDWQADRCRVRSVGGDWEELIEVPLNKSVVRAILARVAALCNERIPNSVSPYGGQGELSVGANPAAVFRVTFVNTPAEQKLELMAETEPVGWQVGKSLLLSASRPRATGFTDMAAKKPRLSLTKSQLQAGVGAELLALCQSVTEDGSLSKDEIIALRAWLEANRSSDLPAISFLTATVERIVADGKVTKDERKDLYKAIEAILPLEARKQAASQRKAVEAREMALEFAEREAQRREDRKEREQKRPLASANFMVAGVHYEGRPEIIERHVEDGDQVYLARDPRNRYSRNAVEIRLRNGMQIGFVPEEDAIDFAPLLDLECSHHAYITKILTGGRVPIPVVQAYIYGSDARLEGSVRPRDVPQRQFYSEGRAYGSSKGSGCLSVLLLAILPLVAGIGWMLRSW